MQLRMIGLEGFLKEITEIIKGYEGFFSCDQANRFNGILEFMEDDRHGMSYDDSLIIIKTFEEIDLSRLPKKLQDRIEAMLQKRKESAGRIAFGEMFG